MVKSGPPSPLRSGDYDAIQDAVMETERGRWFLREFAQRNRNADTEVLLSAIQKLHDNLITEQTAPDAHRITLDLADMANAIAETKKQISAMGSEDGEDAKVAIASNELDAIVRTAEKATGDILNTAEQVQEIAWNLREMGVDAVSCDSLDKYATDIYTACSFQDLTGQRTEKVIKVLQFVENRVFAMMDIWKMDLAKEEHHIETFDGLDSRPDAHLLNGPQLEDNATSQVDIDDMMSDDMFDNPTAEPKLDVGAQVEPEVLFDTETDIQATAIEEEKYDLCKPEVLECVDVPCDTPYDPSSASSSCSPGYIAEPQPRTEITGNETVDAVSQPTEMEKPEDEQVEIGTADEFAGISPDLEQGTALYTPDGNLEQDEDLGRDMLAATDQTPVDDVQKTGEMFSAPSVTTGETTPLDFQQPPATMEVPSLTQGPVEGLEGTDHTYSPSIADEISDEPTYSTEIQAIEDNPTENKLGLSALSQLERQIIFS